MHSVDLTQVLNNFFTSDFNRKANYPQGNQPPEMGEREEHQNRPPATQEGVGDELLSHLDPPKPLVLDRPHPRAGKVLEGELVQLLSIIHHQSWPAWQMLQCHQWGAPLQEGWKEHPGNHRPVSLVWVLGKVREKIILRAIPGHRQDNQRVSHRHRKGRSSLSSLISFCTG